VRELLKVFVAHSWVRQLPIWLSPVVVVDRESNAFGRPTADRALPALGREHLVVLGRGDAIFLLQPACARTVTAVCVWRCQVLLLQTLKIVFVVAVGAVNILVNRSATGITGLAFDCVPLWFVKFQEVGEAVI
jgi:hypothetical protein